MQSENGAQLRSYEEPEGRCSHNILPEYDCPDCEKEYKHRESVEQLADLINLTHGIDMQTAREVAEIITDALDNEKYDVVLEQLKSLRGE